MIRRTTVEAEVIVVRPHRYGAVLVDMQISRSATFLDCKAEHRQRVRVGERRLLTICECDSPLLLAGLDAFVGDLIPETS